MFLFQLDNGNPRDMTNSQIFFEVGSLRKQLTPGDTVDALVLIIQPTEVAFMIGKKLSYILIDETANPDQVLMEGTFIVASAS